MVRIPAAIVAALLVLFNRAARMAAVNGLVRGTVTIDGKPAANVPVTLEGEGSRFNATTRSDGEYVFSEVPFGSYRLTVAAKGIAKYVVIVEVNSGSVATVNVPLSTRLAEIARTTVTAHAGVESNPPSVHQIDRAQIQIVAGAKQPRPDAADAARRHSLLLQRAGHQRIPRRLLQHRRRAAAAGDHLELRRDHRSEDHRLARTLHRRDSGRVRRRPHGRRRQHHQQPARPTFPRASTARSKAAAATNRKPSASSRRPPVSDPTEAFLDANTQSTARGLDAPTFDAIHDNSSQSDQFFRIITQLTPRSTLAFDYSNQLAQFQIPINTDPNNPYDPITTPAGTDDVQREYDRFSNLNYTVTSPRTATGSFQVIPWWRSTRINYDGDLPNDVLGVTPDFSADARLRAVRHAAGRVGFGSGRGSCTTSGCSRTPMPATAACASPIFALYAEPHVEGRHRMDRENLVASQAFACYYADGCGATSGAHQQPYYLMAPPEQAQAGSQIGIYAQDNWKFSNYAQLNYGLRYDHSTGYTSGYMFSRASASTFGTAARIRSTPSTDASTQRRCSRTSVKTASCCKAASGEPVYDLKPEQDAYVEGGWQYAFNPQFTRLVQYLPQDGR